MAKETEFHNQSPDQYLTKNLAALRQKVPDTADWLESAPDPRWAEMIVSSNGEPNLLVSLGPKQSIAYDLDHPLDSPRKKVEEVDLFKQNLTLVLGMGLGYIPQMLLEEMEEGHRVVVIEPNPEIIRLALGLHDFSNHLESLGLVLAGPGASELSQILIAHESVVARGEVHMIMEEYTQHRPDDYLPLAEHTRRVLNQLKSNQATVSEMGSEIATNEIIGLPYTVRARGVADLHNMFPRVPAILVSTGPSLGKNIHLLKEAQDKAIIIATAQALRSLLAYGVKPDFICTIDFGKHNATHLDGLMNVEDVPLVSLCRAQSDLMRDYQGILFVNGTGHSNPNHYLHRLWQHKGIIQSGNSVAHLVFTLGRLIGADPLIWVGQDLALSNTTHFDQVEQNSRIEKNAKGQAIRRIIDPKSEFHEQVIGGTGNLQVPGYYGGQVPTMQGLLSFLTLFEQMLAVSEGRFINATEGGARIKGTEQMPLDQVIETVCVDKIDKSRLKSLGRFAEDGENLMDQILPLLKEEQQGIEAVRIQAKRGLATNTGLTKLMDRSEIRTDDPQGPFTRLLSLNATASNATRDLASGIAAVSLTIHGKQNQIMRRELDVEFKADDHEALKTRIDRNRQILEAAHKAACKASEHYTHSIDIIERYITCRDAEKNTPQSFLDYALVLTEMGDLKSAAQTYRQATEAFPEDLELWEARGRMALKRDRFHEVEETIEALLELDQDHEKVLRLKDDYEDALSSLLDNEEHFKTGIFVRPLVNIRTFLKIRPQDAVALAQLERAEAMMEKKIQEMEGLRAEMIEGERGKIYRYQSLLEENKRYAREENDLSSALICLEEAIEILPDHPQARWGHATTLHHLGRFTEASMAYEKLEVDFPDEPRYMFEHGIVLLHSNKILEGLNKILEAMRRTDRFDSFYFKLGLLHAKMGKFKDAVMYCERYLEKFSSDYLAWTLRGECLIKLGKVQMAIDSCKKALSIKPGFGPALAQLNLLGPERAAATA